ncbi:hypothetical protein Poli38472_007391 [Pythium oligandrum]|uniref:FYVE-type domain-containing protein n=1 Tax=Pythium oligandrum TaxID=41045 RepID=A0A8K1CA84_PYTOL|nr:hypothetical protein Poli38472_007391 [Pythium oligandrum]|eukprot:TMW59246.1 hypothetical protein Poli38472_007391 [Pythium oligandrum]
MALPKFLSPFPQLNLSMSDKQELCRISKRLVGEVLEGYERFVWTDQCKLNPTRWTIVRERDDVRIYQDRQSGGTHDSKDLHVLLAVGTVVGTLDDAMYGVLNHTTDTMRLKTAYVQDTITNCAVLATIQEPKADKPFRSMTVKWFVQSLPLHVRAISKNRDCVYVEATGTKVLPNGERIGFQLIHSIDFPQTRPLPMYTRTNMSLCSIWRQQSADRVQVYLKSFLDVPERLLAPLVVRSTADALISVWRYIHCSQMKKLAWLMRRRTPVMEETKPGYAVQTEKGCATCGKRSSTLYQGMKSMCVVCGRLVCSKCRVQRDLCTVTADGCLVEKRTSFCVPCLTIAVRANAADVARDDLPGRVNNQEQLSDLVRVTGASRFSHPVEKGGDATDQQTLKRRRSLSLLTAPAKPTVDNKLVSNKGASWISM